MKQFLSSLTWILVGAVSLSAEEPKLQLAAPISNHMVLQQGSESEVWGSASPKAEITVSFGGEKLKTESGDAGNWSVTLPPQKVDREGRSLKVMARLGDRETELTVSDILVGEVWMCSGQSNMVRPVAASDHADEAADVSLTRLFKTGGTSGAAISRSTSCSWPIFERTPAKRTARARGRSFRMPNGSPWSGSGTRGWP